MYSVSSSPSCPGLLIPVNDPSSVFSLSRPSEHVDGCATIIAKEGSRCIAVEIQALVAPDTPGGFGGKRTVEGVSGSRVKMIMAVLDRR